MWAGILAALKSLPEIISLIKWAAQAVQNMKENAENANATKKFMEGINKAIETGDTSLLEDFYMSRDSKPSGS